MRILAAYPMWDGGLVRASPGSGSVACHWRASADAGNDRHPYSCPSRRRDTLVAVLVADDQRAAAGDLAGGVGFGPFAVFVGAQHEIVAVEENVLPVLRLYLCLRDDVMSAEVVA